MSISLFLLLMAILFTWLVVRSVRAGHGKILFWLAYLLIGMIAILSADTAHSPLGRLLSQLWASSLVGLPLWWAIQAARRGGRGRS